MSRYQPYPEYKDSGVEWLGEIPENWTIPALKWYITIASGEGLSNNDIEPVPDINNIYKVIGGNGVLGYSAKQNTTVKAFSIGRVGALCGNVHFLDEPCWITDNALKVSSWRKLIDNYMYYMLVAANLNNYANKSAQPLITGGQVKSLKIPFPPLQEQQTIANYLDNATAKIDTLIEKQTRLIALLKEKRQAVISHAVTKGLDPNVKMKDSGEEWLGEVPEHWKVNRVGILFTEAVEYGVTDYPILRVSIHDGVSDREYSAGEMDRKVARSEDRSKYKCVQPDDLVYNMMRAWQGGFGAVKVNGLVSPAYVVARPIKPMSTSYIELLLRTAPATEEMRRYSRGITDFRLRLYWDEFKNMKVVLPPQQEIDEILKHIESKNNKIDTLVEKAYQGIALLKERRIALISAAVTGKIDVRGETA